MKEYREKEYSITWDEQNKIVQTMLFEDFCFDAAVRFRRDAIAIAKDIRSLGFEVHALHDITRLPAGYRLDYRTQAVLMDIMDYVDRIAAVGEKPNAKELLLNFFNTASFLVQGRKMVYFKTRDEAEKWLLSKDEK